MSEERPKEPERENDRTEPSQSADADAADEAEEEGGVSREAWLALLIALGAGLAALVIESLSGHR